MIEATGKCVTPDPYCKQGSNGLCDECISRFYVNLEGRCEAVSPLCIQYVMSLGKCEKCIEGWDLNDGSCGNS